MIKPETMIVLWSCDDEMKVTKLVVINQKDQNERTDKLEASAGCCDEGWLTGDKAYNTPMGLYAHIATSYGFRERKQAFSALRAFAKVDGQSWADDLLDAAGVERPEDD